MMPPKLVRSTSAWRFLRMRLKRLIYLIVGGDCIQSSPTSSLLTFFETYATDDVIAKSDTNITGFSHLQNTSPSAYLDTAKNYGARQYDVKVCMKKTFWKSFCGGTTGVHSPQYAIPLGLRGECNSRGLGALFLVVQESTAWLWQYHFPL